MKAQIVQDHDEIAGLAKDWENLRASCGASVLNSHAIMCSCLRHLPQGADAHFLLMEQGGEIQLIAPFAIFRHRAMGLPIRTLSLAGNGRGMLGLYHSTPLVRDDSSSILTEMMEATRKLPWNTLHFTYLEPTGFISRMLGSLAGISNPEPVRESPCAYIHLADVDKTKVVGGKTGRKLNNLIEGLEANGRLTQRIVDGPDGAERSIGTYIEQHKRRWQKKGSSIFENKGISAFLVDLAKTVAASGNGWIDEVLIDGEVAGQQMIICEGKTAYGYRIGINDTYAKFSPGHIVTAYSIGILKARGFETLDLGPGDESYKRRQGGTYQNLLNADAKRGGLNTLASISNLSVVNKVVGKLGIKDRMIKKVEGE